ncbi:MAG: glycosyltransferase family 2 protein [Mycobacteriales bacterium]
MNTSAVSVVIATRNRRDELARTLVTLSRLVAGGEIAEVIVVDNGSTDRTADLVRQEFPQVTLVPLDDNRGAAGRTAGVRRATSPYVAFSDDDSWWQPGALPRAAELLARHPRLGLVAARLVVGPEGRMDPVAEAMRESPLPVRDGLPGRPVLGFVACAAVVRREAYLAVGGFLELLGVGGEEELLACDLAAAGWHLAYVDDVVAEHWPSAARDRAGRQVIQRRNDALVRWMRRPLPDALAATVALAGKAPADPIARRALAATLTRLPAALRRRHRLPPEVEQDLRLLARQG